LNVFIHDVGVVVARARGLFAAEGLEVTTTVTRSSTEQMRGISAGTYDVAQTSFDNVLAWSGREGAEIVAVAEQVDTAILPVFVRPEIRDWSDLRGRKLAVDAVDTAFALTLRRILLARGLDSKRGDYELVGVGAPAQRLESMKRGETFAAILNPPFDAQGAAAGMVRLLDEKYPGSVWAVNRAWAQSHKNDLVGFLRAWLAGVRWAKETANRDEAIKLIMTNTDLPQQAAVRMLSDLPMDGALNLANLQAVLNIRNELGTPPPLGTALDRYYDVSYYREAAR
jgi:ABC-type nitrate/sulfonate/bicarbonate transport system substrate-binding protein